MTQTVVNFLVTQGSQQVLDPRVFDFEISTDAQTYYTQLMNEINSIYSRGVDVLDANGNPIPGTAPGGPPTQQELATISQDLNILNSWSQSIEVNSSGQQVTNWNALFNPNNDPTITADNAFEPPGSTMTPIASTMTSDMASSLDEILRTLTAAGWNPIASPNDLTAAAQTFGALQSDSGQSVYGFSNLLSTALASATNAPLVDDANTGSMSLQQVLMVDYVSTGNQILYNQMGDLQSAININQSVLSYLNSLQDLMNQKDPQQFVLQLQSLSTLAVDDPIDYSTFESQTFNQTLGAVPSFTQADLASYVDQLTGTPADPGSDPLIQGTFEQLNSSESPTPPPADNDPVTATINYSVQRIINNLQFLENQINTQTVGGGSGLVSAVKTVEDDFQSLVTNNNGIAAWVQDSTAGSEGNYQNDLNQAIVASQSFNDTQREQLSSVMFTFEEFYKSAMSLLTNLSQLIQKMADGIPQS